MACKLLIPTRAIIPSSVYKIGVYDGSRSHWLHDLNPLPNDIKKKRRHRRQQKQCEPADIKMDELRVTTMIVSQFETKSKLEKMM